MNYERLTKLASLLTQHHGQPNRHGFVVAPENDLLLAEHASALKHADRMFDYKLIGTERLGILSVNRHVSTDASQQEKIDYTHDKLEKLEHESFAANPEIAPLLAEYMEYKKSQIIEY